MRTENKYAIIGRTVRLIIIVFIIGAIFGSFNSIKKKLDSLNKELNEIKMQLSIIIEREHRVEY